MIKVYTDGSYKHGLVGYGYMIFDGVELVAKNVTVKRPQTSLKNVEGEIMAVLAAFRKLKELYLNLQGDTIIIASDLDECRKLYQGINDRSEGSCESEKEHNFFSQCKQSVKDIVISLNCKVSFEKIKGHEHPIHNQLDSAILKIINKRSVIQNHTQESKEIPIIQNNCADAYIPSHLFSRYEYEYLKEVFALLKNSNSCWNVEDIEAVMAESGMKYDKTKSLLDRSLEILLDDSVRYGVLEKIDGKYSASDIRDFFYREIKNVTPPIVHTLSDTERKNSVYVQGYKNFIVNILSKSNKALSAEEIEQITIKKNQVWQSEKSKHKLTFVQLLDELVKEGRIKKILKNGKSYYRCSQN
ncbi:MAG: RNase H family protein [Fervidobacterium sp.]|uniref:ribonuclease HI n=1 Tax=Fervidobacterium sp. TaxID=1871331 RepID=UPI0030A26DE2